MIGFSSYVCMLLSLKASNIAFGDPGMCEPCTYILLQNCF
jgi:hypothetical protein